MKLQQQEIREIVCDSRLAGPGTAFVCLRGAQSDGHRYAKQAYSAGCRFFVCLEALDLPPDAAQMIVPDTRIALAELSSAFYGDVAKSLCLIGVTGTKGKSTVASLIFEILNATGHPAALIGTTGITIGQTHTPTVNSTPESLILHKTFVQAKEAGCRYVVMEVSSQAYKMHRVHGITFDVGIFTNLSPDDHIGPNEHADYDEYRDCKAQLFAASRRCFLNADDPMSAYMAASTKAPCVTYGIAQPADLHAEHVTSSMVDGVPGMTYTLDGRSFALQMPGDFNVSNALAATAVCRMLGVSDVEIAEVLRHAAVRGRFERVGGLSDRTFIIDYAHNGMSLRAMLEVLRSYHPSRLICLFGSVGGRTQLRRAELAHAARAYCDLCILTSDNPDFEPPLDIIRDIAAEMGDCPYLSIPDRAEAIAYAVEHSLPGDMILFAGKGHETYQLIEGKKVPFDERTLIGAAIAALPQPATR